jgi:hypothetical protein
MFFERRIQSSVMHRRLRYLALLALRIGLLSLLALAFAGPFINRTATVAGRRTMAVIAIDRSFSMRYGDQIQRAKDEAKRVIAAVPGQALAQVVAVDAHVESLTQPTRGKSELNAAVDAITPTDLASSFAEFVRAVRSMEQTSGMHLDVHFFSDMQETSMPTDFRSLQAGQYLTLHFHRIGNPKRANWAVENVVVTPVLDGNEQPRLTATVAGWNSPATTGHVFLRLDGKILANKGVTLATNGRAQVEFSDFEVPYGEHRGEIHLEPADQLPEDDNFRFSIERQDPRKVLFLYAGGRPSRATLYYKTALESGVHGSLSVQTSSSANAAENEDFSRFAFVVLSDVGELDPKLADSLCAYVTKGGAVLIALGSQTMRAGVIPLSKEQISGKLQLQSVGYVDKTYPAFGSGGEFGNVQFSETAYFVPKPNARVLAKLADGDPLLVEERAGEGRKLIFTSAFDDTTSDFPLHSSFVPFVAQTARFLTGTEENNSSIVAGTPVLLRRTSSSGTADVIGPEGRHELPLEQANRALSYEVSRDGFYEITRADGRRLLLAAHADRRESNLKAVSDETLDLWRNTGDNSGRSDSPEQQTQTQPWSFWRYVLAVALVAGLVESIFANRYLSSRSLKEKRQTA